MAPGGASEAPGLRNRALRDAHRFRLLSCLRISQAAGKMQLQAFCSAGHRSLHGAFGSLNVVPQSVKLRAIFLCLDSHSNSKSVDAAYLMSARRSENLPAADAMSMERGREV